MAALERQLLDGFARAGYVPLRTPILEFTELHERKSGAGIVSKLFELAGGGTASICLRPELTASIVRAFAEAPQCPQLPWRVSSSGPVFRYENEPRAGRLREFTQVGVELIGAGGPAADAEVIGLAHRSLSESGISGATIRIGHVGLILEVLGRTGLPAAAASALVEMLSAAAAEGRGIQTLEAALDRLAGWLSSGGEASSVAPPVAQGDDVAFDRLFRHLVPDVTGRRTGGEIIERLRRKWDLDRSLSPILDTVRQRCTRSESCGAPRRWSSSGLTATCRRSRLSRRTTCKRSLPSCTPRASSRAASSSTSASAAASAFTRR